MSLTRTVVFSYSGRAFAVLSSALLLYSAFPPFGDRFAAWVSLVPLLVLARYSNPKQSFVLGFISGMIFWLLSISWLLKLGETGTHLILAVLGWILLSVYAALYIGLFTYLASHLLRCEDSMLQGERGIQRVTMWRLVLIFALPVLWVGLEYIRGLVFSGFAWNQLGISQYSNLAIAQVAELGGVYLVSAVVMVMNCAVALTGMRLVSVYRRKEASSRFRYELMLGLLICALCWMYGTRTVMRDKAGEPDMVELRIAAVQPNTPQIKKWNMDYEVNIYERLRRQTRLAAINSPDLIIWPETAVMRPYNSDEMIRMFVGELTADGAPILVGAMEKEDIPECDDPLRNWRLYNSSFLVGVDGKTEAVYRKQHLVPFGEFIPFENSISLVKRFVPVGFSCTPGNESTIMNLRSRGNPDVDAKFSVLICFEDTIASISRKAVKAGAVFLVNQTNDAWFDGSAAHLQHMSHCVFRSIENRVPIVRAANTGVTCFIDRYGRVSQYSSESNMSGLAVEGFKVSGIMVGASRANATLYNRCGDLIFALPCAMGVIAIFLFIGYSAKRKRGVKNDR